MGRSDRLKEDNSSILWNGQALPIILHNTPHKPLMVSELGNIPNILNRVRLFHDIKSLVWGGRFSYLKKKSSSTDTSWSLYYKCHYLYGRLCHIMWSRKWCNLPPQTLNISRMAGGVCLCTHVWAGIRNCTKPMFLISITMALKNIKYSVLICNTVLKTLNQVWCAGEHVGEYIGYLVTWVEQQKTEKMFQEDKCCCNGWGRCKDYWYTN